MKELRKVKNRYEFQLESRQVVLIVSGLILVLMLSFLMGALFGVNMAKMKGPDQKTVASDQPEKSATQSKDQKVAKAPAEAMSDEAIEPNKEKQLTESGNSREDLIRELERLKVPDQMDKQKDSAKEKEEVSSKKETSNEPAKPEPSEKDSPAEKKKETSTAGKDTSSSQSQASSAGKQESQESSSTRHVARAGTYTIQLASFPERQDAVQMVGNLKSSKYDAYMVQVSLPEKGTFYRVRVGHYEDLEQAKKALTIIQSREGKFYDAWITQ